MKFKAVLLCLFLLSAEVFASTKLIQIEKIVSSLIDEDLVTCQKYLPECSKLFELTMLRKSLETSIQLRSTFVFGSVYDLSTMCSDSEKNECKIISAALSFPSHAECLKLEKESASLCLDLQYFQMDECKNIKDSFLKSICTKVVQKSCQDEIVCSIAWAYFFRDRFEGLENASTSIKNAFIKKYNADKSTVQQILMNLPHKASLILGHSIVKPANFPLPKIVDHKLIVQSKLNGSASKPFFKELFRIKNTLPLKSRLLLQPWKRGEGITVADWNGDGYMDIFTVEDDKVLFYENIAGKSFNLHSLKIPNLSQGEALIDVSLADLDGNKQLVLLVQSFPNLIHLLRWSKAKNCFLVEVKKLPNNSRTHAFVQLKKGLGIVFPGWNGIASSPNPKASDYFVKIQNKNWNFEKIKESDAPSLGVSVVQSNKNTFVSINRDLEGPSDLYKLINDHLVKIPLGAMENSSSHSSTFIDSEKRGPLWVMTGVGFHDDEKIIHKNKTNHFGNISQCQKDQNDYVLCLMNLTKRYTNNWPSLCRFYKESTAVNLCFVQNQQQGLSKKSTMFNFKAQALNRLAPTRKDETLSSLLSSFDQIWHLASVRTKKLEGLLLAEAGLNKYSTPKIWWVSTHEKVLNKTDLTNDLMLNGELHNGQFALADIDNDNQDDLIIKSETDLIIYKGKMGEKVLDLNTQSGFQSRVLQEIPKSN